MPKLKPHYEEIVRLAVAGMRPFQIAERIDMNPVSVRQILKKPEVVEALEALSYAREVAVRDINSIIFDDAANSLNLLIKLRDDAEEKPELRAKIAMDLLDRASVKETEAATERTSAEGIVERVRQRAREAKIIV